MKGKNPGLSCLITIRCRRTLSQNVASGSFRYVALQDVAGAQSGLEMAGSRRQAGPIVRSQDQIDARDGWVIGFAQALALIPGVSRSGATISFGLFQGLTRTAAARYSFLLSVPAVVLSGLFELRHIGEHGNTAGAVPTAIATITAFVVGYATIAWLLRYVTRHSMMIFVTYRVFAGTFLLTLLSLGVITAQ